VANRRSDAPVDPLQSERGTKVLAAEPVEEHIQRTYSRRTSTPVSTQLLVGRGSDEVTSKESPYGIGDSPVSPPRQGYLRMWPSISPNCHLEEYCDGNRRLIENLLPSSEFDCSSCQVGAGATFRIGRKKQRRSARQPHKPQLYSSSLFVHQHSSFLFLRLIFIASLAHICDLGFKMRCPSLLAGWQLYIHVDSKYLQSRSGEVVAVTVTVTVEAHCRSTGRTGRIERTNWVEK
jgi:hypothetical protein